MKFHRTPMPSAYESGQWGSPDAPCPSARTLAARLDGELDAERAAAVDAHLRTCPVCESDFRRVESLSGCLRAWDAKAQGMVPPQRLASRILRDVDGEAGVRQRQRVSAGRRALAVAAAVLLAIGGGAFLGVEGARSAGVAPIPASGADAGRIPVAVIPLRGLSLPPLLVAIPPSRGATDSASPTAAETPPVDLATLRDGDAKEPFARWAALKDIEDRLGEPAWWRGGRALASFAVRDFDRRMRLRERMDDYDRRVQEMPTVVKGDARTYLPFSSVFPLPVAEGPDAAELPFREAAAFVRGLYPSEVSPADGAAAVLLRFIPDGGTSAKLLPPAASGVLDLPEAVKKGRVSLRDEGRPDSLVVDVHSDVPVFVPAGELIAGGLVDRAVARGAWLREGAYSERLACRPVARAGVRPAARPTPVGAIAGPGLRGLLAGGAPQAEVQALVDSMLDAAGIDPASTGASLATLYGADAAGAERARARAASVPFYDADRGFLAADADGRFQGVEVVGSKGGAGTALLRRLLVGYLVEAQGRAAGAARGGPAVDTAIFDLARKAPPLLAPEGRVLRVPSLSGQEPVTGIALQAVPVDGGGVAHASALLPEHR